MTATEIRLLQTIIKEEADGLLCEAMEAAYSFDGAKGDFIHGYLLSCFKNLPDMVTEKLQKNLSCKQCSKSRLTCGYAKADENIVNCNGYLLAK